MPDDPQRLPSLQAVSLVGLAVLSFGLKYLTSLVLANTLGIEDYEHYAVAIASLVFFSTVVELGLGKQGLRLIPQSIEAGEATLAAGYWRFTTGSVLILAVVTALLVISTQEVPVLAPLASDEGMYLLPIVALAGVGAELVLACGAAITATIVVRILIPIVPLSFVLWASRSVEYHDSLAPKLAIFAYGGGWLLGLLLLVIAFIWACPKQVLRGPAEYRPKQWLRGSLGFLGVAFAISALVDGTVALAELASLSRADISIYAVCIETGGFVLILVKSLDKFYLQRISALVARGDLREIHRIRRRRAALMLGVCVAFCAGIFMGGRPLLASFGASFERGYFSLCCIALATSAWTLTSLSQWLIAFIDGPRPALRITLGGVFATYSAILLLGPAHGLVGVALAYGVMVTIMAVMLELRARSILARLAKAAKTATATPPGRT